MNTPREQILIDKIKRLPLERITEVEDFIDFLYQRDQPKPKNTAPAKESFNFPVDHVGNWPQSLSLSRADLYNDDGR